MKVKTDAQSPEVLYINHIGICSLIWSVLGTQKQVVKFNGFSMLNEECTKMYKMEKTFHSWVRFDFFFFDGDKELPSFLQQSPANRRFLASQLFTDFLFRPTLLILFYFLIIFLNEYLVIWLTHRYSTINYI